MPAKLEPTLWQGTQFLGAPIQRTSCGMKSEVHLCASFQIRSLALNGVNSDDTLLNLGLLYARH